MYLKDEIYMGLTGDKRVMMNLKMSNRHGLIAGASGTGKTITIKVMAESFSDAGVLNTVTITATINGVSKSTKYIIEPEMYFLTTTNYEFRDNWTSSVGNTVIIRSPGVQRNYDITSYHSSIIAVKYTPERYLEIKCLKPGTDNITLTSYAGQKRTYTGYTCK
ncbi:MAG: DUF853 family protein [Mollicutes bacterium]|nr:DUF853 family protein [Mollicutes bacterium]